MNSIDEINMTFGSSNNEIDLNIKSIEEEISFITSNTTAGTDNYNKLINKPSINNVELVDNKTIQELGIQPSGEYPDETLSNSDIEELLNNFS